MTLDPDDVYGWIRTWRNALTLAERSGRWKGRGAHRLRLALRAFGWAAQCTGELEQEFGVRAHALATQRDPTTVAVAHRELAAEDDPFIVKVVDAHGPHGHRYRLRIPEEFFDAAVAMPWQGGRIEALHPVFRLLGDIAGLVYEVLDEHGAKQFDVAAAAVVSPRAAHDALRELAAHGLAIRDRDGWRRGLVDSTEVARALGALDATAECAARYRRERAEWHAYLGLSSEAELSPRPSASSARHVDDDANDVWPDDPPPDDEATETPLQILERLLGAVPIDAPLRPSQARSGSGNGHVLAPVAAALDRGGADDATNLARYLDDI